VPPPGQPLDEVPEDWPKKAPAVRAELAELINIGVKIELQVPPIEEDPDTVYNNLVKRAPGGNLDSYLNGSSQIKVIWTISGRQKNRIGGPTVPTPRVTKT